MESWKSGSPGEVGVQHHCIRHMREEDLHMCLKGKKSILRIKKFSFVTRWVACISLLLVPVRLLSYFSAHFRSGDHTSILNEYMISTVHEYI